MTPGAELRAGPGPEAPGARRTDESVRAQAHHYPRGVTVGGGGGGGAEGASQSAVTQPPPPPSLPLLLRLLLTKPRHPDPRTPRIGHPTPTDPSGRVGSAGAPPRGPGQNAAASLRFFPGPPSPSPRRRPRVGQWRAAPLAGAPNRRSADSGAQVQNDNTRDDSTCGRREEKRGERRERSFHPQI